MAAEERKQFEVLKEGFAKATFGGALSGCSTLAVGGPIKFAAVEDNGGLNPEEFYVTQARLLSMAVTPYRMFDFTKEGVLKAAVKLFEGLTLYANHRADVNDWKGLVQECVWDDKNDPPGINGMLVIDKTVDPKLARGVEIKALRSVSVTIWFKYERSHPNLDYFWDRLGEVVDGQLVRFIVTEITNAGEVSIVWEGEDPHAKTFSAPGNKPGAHSASNHEEEKEMKLTVATLAALGLAAGTEVTEEMLEQKIVGLTKQVDQLKVDAAVGVATLKETRERAVTLYKASKGEKVVESFVTNVLEKADLETCRAYCLEYEGEVEKNVPLACPKCGEKLARRSSVPEPVGGNLNAPGKRIDDFKSA
uniref:Uncharacterized protein n=1 Tax=Geobacter sp. (strain M21) TaxID=443144 RepID=C6E6R3_GEOSM